MRVGIMIEGAWGLNWPRWQRLVRAADELGFNGLYRSDHFLDGREGSFQDALEAMVSLTWAADNSTRIELGSLVHPVSFRDPRILAWQATAINDLAKGRFAVGLGAGWQELEHTTFGFELGSMDERFARLEEGLQVIRALTRSDEPVSMDGERYPLQNAMLKPRFPEQNSPAIIIGGKGPKRTLPLVAKYADEWNGLGLNNDDFRERNSLLDEMLAAEGRDPKSVRRSLMCGSIIARDQATLDADPDRDRFDEFRARGAVIGTPAEVVEILGRKAEAGIESVMLQWMDQDDIAGLELLASEVLPHVQG